MKSTGSSDSSCLVPLENFRRRFRLGVSTVAISSKVDIPETEQLLRRTIRLVETSDQQSRLLHTDLLLEFESPDAILQAPETIGEISATNDLKGARTLDGYYWWCGSSTLQVFSNDVRIIVQIRSDFWDFSLFLQRQFFLMAFYMMLRKRGQYCLHTNGVVYENKPCLIAGNSGSGKSTLSLSLALQGWHFWGDDTIAIRQGKEDMVTGLALRCGSACSMKTANIMNEVKALYDNAPALQDGKRLLNVESLSGFALVPEANPAILIFPTIRDEKHSTIGPMEQTSAMARLIGLSAGILTNRDEVELQMSLLEKLTRQAQAFEMFQGRDVIDEPGRVADLLTRTVTAH